MVASLRENCGIGVVYDPHDAIVMKSQGLAHRGQDTEGYARRNGNGIHAIRAYRGRIEETALRTILGNHRETPILVHTKYRTRGAADRDSVLVAAHPHTLDGVHYVHDDSIRTTGARKAMIHNGTLDEELFSYQHFPNETGCDTETLMRADDSLGPEEVILSGATTFCVAELNGKDEFVTLYKDFEGRMSLWIGFDKDGNYIAASEDYAIIAIGGTPLREVRPGELIRMCRDRLESVQVAEPHKLNCFFHANYFAHHNSYLWEEFMRNGNTVEQFRGMLGEAVVSEYPYDGVDFVAPLPRSPIPAAKAISRLTGKPYRELFYKLKTNEPGSEDWVRAFLQLDPVARRLAIEQSLFVNERLTPNGIGHDFALIEDSLVRGNNVPVAKRKAEERGFRLSRVDSYTPMIGGRVGDQDLGCRHGIDMPPLGDNFIASRNNRNPEKISAEIGTPVNFLSPEKMLQTFEKAGMRRAHLCTECILPCYRKPTPPKKAEGVTSSSTPLLHVQGRY